LASRGSLDGGASIDLAAADVHRPARRAPSATASEVSVGSSLATSSMASSPMLAGGGGGGGGVVDQNARGGGGVNGGNGGNGGSVEVWHVELEPGQGKTARPQRAASSGSAASLDRTKTPAGARSASAAHYGVLDSSSNTRVNRSMSLDVPTLAPPLSPTPHARLMVVRDQEHERQGGQSLQDSASESGLLDDTVAPGQQHLLPSASPRRSLSTSLVHGRDHQSSSLRRGSAATARLRDVFLFFFFFFLLFFFLFQFTKFE
jgi:hypothetical protein